MASDEAETEEELTMHLLSPPEHDYDITELIHIASNIPVKFDKAGECGEMIQRYVSALRKTKGGLLISDSTFEKIPVSLRFSEDRY